MGGQTFRNVGSGINGAMQGFQAGWGMARQSSRDADDRRRTDIAESSRQQEMDRRTAMDKYQMDRNDRLDKSEEQKSSLAEANVRLQTGIRAVYAGFPEQGVQLMNQGISPESPNYIKEMSVNPEDGTLSILRNDGKVVPVPFAQVASVMPGFDAPKADSMSKPDDFTRSSALQEFGEYFNVGPRSETNPDGITARQERAITSGLMAGKSFGEIGKSLKLVPIARESDVVKAEQDYQSAIAEYEGAPINNRSGLLTSQRTMPKEQIDDLNAKRQAMVGAGKKAQYLKERGETDVNQIRYSGFEQGLQGGMQRQQSPAQPLQGQAPVASTINIKAIDDNQDGILDERDRIVQAALHAEANPGMYDPRDLEEADAILKEYRKVTRSKAQAVMGTQEPAKMTK
jgi:hypothetical protein